MNKTSREYKNKYQREYMKKNRDKIQPRRRLMSKMFFYKQNIGNKIIVKPRKMDFPKVSRSLVEVITRQEYFDLLKQGKCEVPPELTPFNSKVKRLRVI